MDESAPKPIAGELVVKGREMQIPLLVAGSKPSLEGEHKSRRVYWVNPVSDLVGIQVSKESLGRKAGENAMDLDTLMGHNNTKSYKPRT